MVKTKFMTRIFSAIENDETEILEQLDKDIDIAKEDGSCEGDQYVITASDDKVILHDKVNNEDTEIIEDENGEVTFSKVEDKKFANTFYVGLVPESKRKPGSRQGIGESFYETSDIKHKKKFTAGKDAEEQATNWARSMEEKDGVKYIIAQLQPKEDTGNKKDQWVAFSKVDLEGNDAPDEELPLIEEKDFSNISDDELDSVVTCESIKFSKVKKFSLESLKSFAKGGWRDGKLYIKMGDSDVALDLKNKVAIVIDENLSCPIDPKKSFIDNLTTVEKFMKENNLKVFSSNMTWIVFSSDEEGYKITYKKFNDKNLANDYANKLKVLDGMFECPNDKVESLIKKWKSLPNRYNDDWIKFNNWVKEIGATKIYSDANLTPVKVDLKTVAKLLPYSVVSKKDKLWVSGAVDQESAEAVAKSLNSKTDKYNFEVITTEEVNKGNYKSDPKFITRLSLANYKKTSHFSEGGYGVFLISDRNYTPKTHKPWDDIPKKWFDNKEDADNYVRNNSEEGNELSSSSMDKEKFDRIKSDYNSWHDLYLAERKSVHGFSDSNPTPEQEGVINFSKVFSKSESPISDKKFSRVADLLIDLEDYVFGAQGDIKTSLQKFARDHKMDFKDAKEAAIMMLKIKDLTDDWGNFNESEGANGVSQKVKDDLIARVKRFSDDNPTPEQEGDKNFSGSLDRSSMQYITDNDQYRVGDTITRSGEQFELTKLISRSDGEYIWEVKAYSNKFSKFSPAVAKMFSKK